MAMLYKTLLRSSHPRWFGIGWDGPTKSLFFTVNGRFAQNAKPIEITSPPVAAALERIPLAIFSGHLASSAFGLNGGIKCLKILNDYLYSIALKPIRIETGESCSHCGGKGKYEDSEDDCLRCDGKGKVISFQWQDIHLVAWNICILLQALIPAYEKELLTSSKTKQLMTIETTLYDGACVLHGVFGPEMIAWLSRFENGHHFKCVGKAMRDAHEVMFGTPHQLDRFEAYSQGNGKVILSCPGNGSAFIHLNGAQSYGGVGLKFSDHGDDNPGLQLCLLVGLAALYMLAETEMP